MANYDSDIGFSLQHLAKCAANFHILTLIYSFLHDSDTFNLL